MIGFALRRLLAVLPLMLVVVTLTFFLVEIAPGSPFNSEHRLSSEVEANLKHKYGLDQPKILQYALFLARLTGFTYSQELKGWSWAPYPDFGDSMKYRDRTVNQIIKDGLSISVFLGVAAYALAFPLGLGIGILSAYKQNSWLDRVFSGFAALAISTPTFILGPVLITVFSLNGHWLPPARVNWIFESGFLRVPTFRTCLLPVITLSTLYVGSIARLVRGGMIEALGQDYVRTARAKGLSERRVVFRHALREALLPVASYSGPALAFLLTGTAVVERIFAIPGLGSYFIDAATSRDYFLILGLTTFGAFSLILMNVLSDMALAWLDPRIRLHVVS